MTNPNPDYLPAPSRFLTAALPAHVPSPSTTPVAQARYHDSHGYWAIFDIFEVGAMPPDLPGIYIFCRPGIFVWDPLYVGETDSLCRRVYVNLDYHHSWPRARGLGATHIAVLSVPGTRDNRLAIETWLRQQLLPVCNDQ